MLVTEGAASPKQNCIGGAFLLMSALVCREDMAEDLVVGLFFVIGGFAIILVRIPRLIRTDRSDQRLIRRY